LKQRKIALDAWGNLLTEIITGQQTASNVVAMRGTTA
jgi:hypothetical protein